MPREKLDSATLSASVAELKHWKLKDGELIRELQFKDFVKAMAFVNHVAEMAEAAGHHPDIDIRYNKVRLALVTHDVGGITKHDVNMAAALDETEAKHRPIQTQIEEIV